ncbi:hypothetical protein FHR32_002059 [Streptosporangium album]|uniref:Outer membrane channel protein CpnT-like N-terminal domain-containing protein n=1 Tax=Streptosporangium album TaxID=47479 RepID=A0A7W7W965_9ACTN|nr:hypothetical protein [Streptosporangium album]MBB4937754.1 hypothetical protein [Streptosporangium album]
MGVTLPPEVNGMLGMLGVPWPNLDEDEIRKDAGAWRTVLAGTEQAGGGADATVRRTMEQTYKGDSADAMAGFWEKTGNSGGHLAQAAAAAKLAPVALDGTAMVVTAVKVAVATQAVAAAVKVGRAMLIGGPLGVGAATATMFSTRFAMGRILREGSEGTGRVLAPALSRRVTHPLQNILEKLRGPGGGGGPALAGAGGPRVPMGRSPIGRRGDRPGDMPGMAKMGRKDKEKEPKSQENRKPHTSSGSKSTRDKHQKAASHGGKKKFINPNKKPKNE